MPSGNKYTEMLQPEFQPQRLSLELDKIVALRMSSSSLPGQVTDLDKTVAPDASSSTPPERMTYLDKMAALKALSTSPPKPKFKKFFKKLSKLKFWRRIFGTAGVVTEG